MTESEAKKIITLGNLATYHEGILGLFNGVPQGSSSYVSSVAGHTGDVTVAQLESDLGLSQYMRATNGSISTTSDITTTGDVEGSTITGTTITGTTVNATTLAVTNNATVGGTLNVTSDITTTSGTVTAKHFVSTVYNAGNKTGALTLDARNGDIQIVTCTGNISSVSITNAVAGLNILVIFYTTASDINVSINHNSSTYICPDAEQLTLSIAQNGYVEVGFLAETATKFYVRGV